MKTKLSLFIATMTMTLMALAQKERLSFHPSVQVGLLEGSRGGALQLQAVQSLQYKTLSAGLGVGLDYYHTRSLPLFVDIRKALSKKEQRPFLYADGGYHFPWLTTDDKQNFIVSAKGGFYYDAGIGYEFPVMKKNRFFFSAGMSGKEFLVKQQVLSIIEIYPPFPITYYQYHYRLTRVSIKMGLTL